MALINLFLIIALISIACTLFSGTKSKGLITLGAVIINSLLSSIVAIQALKGITFEHVLTGTIHFGDVNVKIDALSAWFILTINFTIITGAIYGLNYMKQYVQHRNEITMHCIAYILVHTALISICAVQNGMVFLLFWEIMALSAFILVTFEHYKAETLRAGINYLIQSHISIVFLMLGFIYVVFKTGSFDFKAVSDFSLTQSTLAGSFLFLIFFIGFAIKAGFVPFHTWLPYAHPAAPSHVSGIMSGVIIKIGIYGILRMLLLIKMDYTSIGLIILFISIISGIYGVMLAIIQHNLKRLLAYHSIENIGIIGIGIGIGCVGLGTGNKWLAILGFSGGLLHTLNHSLFKSLLFYGAGNVYQSTHTMSIDQLGGIIKQMPKTALLFLIAALAICGLPPFNGFISEFLIYSGLYHWLFSASLISLMIIAFSLFGLVMIGGLAFLCFTKAFSVVFLGTSRHLPKNQIHEVSQFQLVPMYLVAILLIAIGVFPSFFLNALQLPVNLFTQNIGSASDMYRAEALNSLQKISLLSGGFIFLILVVIGLRILITRYKSIETSSTWGCGYVGPMQKVQYTASSFVRSFIKLAKPVLEIKKKDIDVKEIFPSRKHYETHPYDKIEKIIIDKPLKMLKVFMGWFLFLQNGKLQRYILYGILFIAAVICIPFFLGKLMTFIEFLNHL